MAQPERLTKIDKPFGNDSSRISHENQFNRINKNSKVYSLLQRMADEERAKYYYNKAI